MSLTAFLILVAAVALLGHFGLPEKRLPDPPPTNEDLVTEESRPYRFEGQSGIAFLLCHGFGDSAFNTKPLGEVLHALGHTAIGVLLPGHGTRIEDMVDTRYHHYYDHLERIYLQERGRYKQVFLVGFSMGGTLSLDLAARNADFVRPAGVITISSPVFFNGFFGGRFVLHQPMLTMTGILRMFVSVIRLGRERPKSLDRSNPWQGYYATYPLDALHSFKRAMSVVRRGLPKISVPYCSIMAANDRTVHSANQPYIYNRIQSREKRAFMFILPPDLSTMHSLLTHRNASARVFRFIEEFVQDTLGGYEGPHKSGAQRAGKGGLGFWSGLFARRVRKPENLAKRE